MSITEQLEDTDVNIDEISSRIAKETIPGGSNEPFEVGIARASAIVPFVIQDLNNWFNILEVRILGDDHISMPMRYRWSIIRWAKQDMDSWLMANGWEDLAHLNADTRSRREDELEARYRKEYGDITVDCNFLVHFPEVVFEKLNQRSDKSLRDKQEQYNKRQNTIEEVIEARRG